MCAHGRIVVAEALVCARQRPPQFPLRPYKFRVLQGCRCARFYVPRIL